MEWSEVDIVCLLTCSGYGSMVIQRSHHSLTHSLTHTHTRSLTHSRTHSLTHSLLGRCVGVDDDALRGLGMCPHTTTHARTQTHTLRSLRMCTYVGSMSVHTKYATFHTIFHYTCHTTFHPLVSSPYTPFSAHYTALERITSLSQANTATLLSL